MTDKVIKTYSLLNDIDKEYLKLFRMKPDVLDS